MFRIEMRRRTLIILTLAVGALLAWVAAPALSLRPWVPAATDFEQELPAPVRLDTGGRGAGAADAHRRAHGAPGAAWISPVVEAPHPFDLVGIAGETRPVEIRVREAGGPWSEWVETHGGDPVYVGGADESQVRAAFRPRGRLHYVNVSGTAGGAAGRLLNAARGAINEAFVSAAGSFVAEARPKKPRFVSRASWGATLEEGGCPPRQPAEYGEVRAGVVHHTVNANDYTEEEAAGIVLGICRFHVYGNGWDDIGYQALVDRFGRVYKGRAGGMNAAVVGAHAEGFNTETTAIASIGTNTTTKLNRKAKTAVVNYLAWKLSLHGAIPATGKTQLTSGGGSLNRYPTAGTVINVPRVTTHRRLGLTECPGSQLYNQTGSIRRLVQAKIKRTAKPVK